MWKIGPEWAAQHAKFASDRIQNTGVFSACANVMSAADDASGGRDSGGPAIGRGSWAKQQRGRQDDGPGDEAEREHGEAPVMGDDQPARERRHQRRAQRQTGRDKGNGEAAMAHEPTGGGSGQRDIYRTDGEPGEVP